MKRYLHVHGWLDSPVWGDSPYTEREAWSWMIGEAAWKIVVIPDPVTSAPVRINRGQFSASLRFMANKWGWQKDKVRRYLAKLEKWQMIVFATGSATENATTKSIVTICNYNRYQFGGEYDETEIATGNATTPRQPRDKQEEYLRQGKKDIPNGISKEKFFPRPECVCEQVWDDFKKLRAQKKAPITETAMAGMAREAVKAGISLEAAIVLACERGWTSFKADWIKGNGGFVVLGNQRKMDQYKELLENGF